MVSDHGLKDTLYDPIFPGTDRSALHRFRCPLDCVWGHWIMKGLVLWALPAPFHGLFWAHTSCEQLRGVEVLVSSTGFDARCLLALSAGVRVLGASVVGPSSV